MKINFLNIFSKVRLLKCDNETFNEVVLKGFYASKTHLDKLTILNLAIKYKLKCVDEIKTELKKQLHLD